MLALKRKVTTASDCCTDKQKYYAKLLKVTFVVLHLLFFTEMLIHDIQELNMYSDKPLNGKNSKFFLLAET